MESFWALCAVGGLLSIFVVLFWSLFFLLFSRAVEAFLRKGGGGGSNSSREFVPCR